MTTTPTRRRKPPAPPAAAPDSRAFPPPTDASEQLVEDNLGLARQAAWKWSKRTGQAYDDLEAVAFVGLIRGCRRYDPTRLNPANGQPYALSTIVCPYVTGEILHWFRDRGHAVKFPAKWREVWGKVQRLLNDPAIPPDQVAALAGLSQAELNEMIGSMTGTVCLDETFGVTGSPAPEIEEPDRLAPLQALVQQAWENLHQADQSLLLSWWGRPHKQALPQGPLQQFHARLKALLHGRTLREVMQLELCQVERVPVERKLRAPRKVRELATAAVQLGLLAC
jgi:DNA-directed RNA polymerase specialized sigma subunit